MACTDCKNENAEQLYGSFFGERVCTDCYRERRHKEFEKVIDSTGKEKKAAPKKEEKPTTRPWKGGAWSKD